MKKQEKEIIKVEEQKNIEIFGSRRADEVISKASEIAKVVSNIVESKRLYTVIKNKKFVQCEGWTTMGAILGLFPQIVEVREEKNDKGVKYIAVCEVRTADGKLISRAESECASWEKNKVGQEEYALRSMAETRAVSKAFRICLSWVMVLAGFEPTPAEEIVAEMIEQPQPKEMKIKKITILDNGEVKTEEEQEKNKKGELKTEEKQEDEQENEQKTIPKRNEEILNKIRVLYKKMLENYSREQINNWLKIAVGVSLENLAEEKEEKLKKVLTLFEMEEALRRKEK